jgi:hypothetical protein
MTSPCPRCGATRSDPVPHGTAYKLVKLLGYRLQRCAQCRLPRFIPRVAKKSPDLWKKQEPTAVAPSAVEPVVMAQEKLEPKENPTAVARSSEAQLGRCPSCGSSRYHRTRRTSTERFLSRPSMARCETCGARFVYPAASESEQEPETVEELAEHRNTSERHRENSQPNETTEGSSRRGRRGCPACGSTEYRRSHRTTLERMLRRPKMARCRKCRHRFPYPNSR